MSLNFEKRLVSLEPTNIPENMCWNTPREFIEKLSELMVGVINSEASEDFIVVGHLQPTPEQNNKLWARFSINRNWIGWYAFIKDSWKKLYSYNPDDVIWKFGDSRNIEEGFQLINANTAIIPQTVRSKILSQYVETSSGSGIYNYFAVLYVGY